MATLGILPVEILLNIALFLDPFDVVALQHVCKRLLLVARDDTLWRELSYLKSSFLERIIRRRELIMGNSSLRENGLGDLAQALANGNGLGGSRLAEASHDLKAQANEKIRTMANWDPSYPTERVRWYDEYIARNAPISTSWFEQPRNRESAEHEHLEIRGLGLYTPPGENESSMVVAPLDDGSICIWDLSGNHGRKKGGIVARSKPGILSVDQNPQTSSKVLRSRMINSGVTECVSVDSSQGRAYIAVQSGLIEVDLETLRPVSHERFPFSITALSEARFPVPLTVGTNLELYLHDIRVKRYHSKASGDSEKIDLYDSNFDYIHSGGSQNFRTLLNPNLLPEYAHLYQPGPLSILHTTPPGSTWDGTGNIYVAGRFSSILTYDRRNFPKLRGTIHSGARLCSLASLPYPFASMEKDLARRGELSIEQIHEAKTRPGSTLIACGEYNSKGSLEMYGLSEGPMPSSITPDSSTGILQHSVMKNRQTCSSSKLFSVACHGTRLVVSDGGGNLKWLERDGFTESRKWNIAHGSSEGPRGIFGSLGDHYMDSGSGDIAIKVLNTHDGTRDRAINEDGLVLWTGEKIGLLNFSSKPGFTSSSFEETTKTAEETRKEREEEIYADTMRRALQAQADEVRFVRGLGAALYGDF